MAELLRPVPARVYQQFDADLTRDVPAEGYGGWKECLIALDLSKTAVVVMHAWEPYSSAEYPGWYRAVEYLPRSKRILETVFPPLLEGLRLRRMHIYHVVADGEYFQHYPGYQRAVELAGPDTPTMGIEKGAAVRSLFARHEELSFVGANNTEDVRAARAVRAFPKQAEPRGEEGVALTARQLLALSRADGVDHLIYCGFAVNWCLLMSPGGMIDMSRFGLMCSVFEDAVTAVENKESAASEGHKEEALWRIALSFGFVLNTGAFLGAVDPSTVG